MAAFLVRVAREADHEALLATTFALNRFEHEITGDRAIDVASAEAVLGHFIRRVGSTGLTLVAEAEGRVIGHLFLALDEAPPYLAPDYRREAWICDAFIEEAWRGQGAFRAMLALAEAHARAGPVAGGFTLVSWPAMMTLNAFIARPASGPMRLRWYRNLIRREDTRHQYRQPA
jgi:GNAT superfamily N-acetyltransferase